MLVMLVMFETPENERRLTAGIGRARRNVPCKHGVSGIIDTKRRIAIQDKQC